jgi:hypothetical protein
LRLNDLKWNDITTNEESISSMREEQEAVVSEVGEVKQMGSSGHYMAKYFVICTGHLGKSWAEGQKGKYAHTEYETM